jgi:20S proteasome alpha/beta subunit
MTLLVGIQCRDGVVIAADRQATLGTAMRPTVGSSITKISQIKSDSALFAFSGFTGLGQQIGYEVERVLDLGESYATNVARIQPAVHATVAGFAQRGQLLMQMGIYPDARNEALCHSLAAVKFHDGLKLFEITPTGACDLASGMPWASAGAGKGNADPIMAFLWDIYWRDRSPRLAEAVFTAYWAVNATIETKAFGVGFEADVFVLEPNPSDGASTRQISQAELTDDLDFIRRIKDVMREFRDDLVPSPETIGEDKENEPPTIDTVPDDQDS